MSMPSGKFVVRLPPETHARLRREAHDRGISLNELCTRLLEGCGSNKARPTPSDRDSIVAPALVERLRQHWKRDLVGVFVFGSQARGEATATSDIDLLLVFNAGFRLSRALYSEFDELVNGAGVVSPHFVNLPAHPLEAGGLWYEVAIEGTPIWERELLVSRFLATVRAAMARGEVQRAVSHGHPYWIKNPPGTR